MSHYRRFAVLAIIVCWSLAAHAASLRLGDGEGVYGLTIRAVKAEGLSARHAANILSLVVADNHIDLEDLWSQPTGKPIIVKDRYLRMSFRPNRMAIQQSKMIFDLEPSSAAGTGQNAEELAAQKAALQAMEQRAKIAEEKNTSLLKQNVDRNAAILRKLNEKDAEIKRLTEELKAAQEAKRASAVAEFLQGVRSFFRIRPFLVSFTRYALVLLVLLSLVLLLGFLLRKKLILRMKSGRTSVAGGEEVKYKTELSRRCLCCLDRGVPEEDALILDEDWSDHLELVHGKKVQMSSGPRPVNDPDMIIGSEASR